MASRRAFRLDIRKPLSTYTITCYENIKLTLENIDRNVVLAGYIERNQVDRFLFRGGRRGKEVQLKLMRLVSHNLFFSSRSILDAYS